MGVLTSDHFKNDQRCQDCSVDDTKNVRPGTKGEFVKKIQTALNKILKTSLVIDGDYGNETTKAVVRFKTERNILNHSNQIDPVVGKKTIVALDKEMGRPPPTPAEPKIPIIGIAGGYLGHLGPTEPKAHIVLDYYKLCGLESVGAGQLEVPAMTRFKTFEGLIDHLLAKPILHNVVVNHGDPIEGVLINLCPETEFRKTGFVIGSLATLADRAQFGKIDTKDPENRENLNKVMRDAHIPEPVVMRIVNKLVRLREMPRFIHLRACRMKHAFLARQYKRAFGAAAMTFHETRLLFQQVDPKLLPSGQTVDNVFARTPSTQERRGRRFVDSLGEIASMFIGIIVIVDPETGHEVQQDSVQLIERRDAIDLTGWMEALVRRWSGPLQRGFVIPIMWMDIDDDNKATETFSWNCPLEVGWNARLKFA